MADEQEKDAGEIHTAGTVPPPPGGDAYDAPTRVGEMSSALWKAVTAAQLPNDVDLAPPRLPKLPGSEPSLPQLPGSDPSVPVVSVNEALTSPALPEVPSDPVVPVMGKSGVPSVIDDEEEGEGDNATLLHPSALRYSLPPPNLPPARRTPPPPAYDEIAAGPAIPPPMALPIPEMVGPQPNDTAWPFAPALVKPNPTGERKQAILVAAAAAIVGIFAAILIWRWLL